MQIIYGNGTQGLYTLFQNQIIYLRGTLISFTLCWLLLSKNVFFRVQKQNDKPVFREIEIIRVWNIVSSVALRRNLVDFRFVDELEDGHANRTTN